MVVLISDLLIENVGTYLSRMVGLAVSHELVTRLIQWEDYPVLTLSLLFSPALQVAVVSSVTRLVA